MAKPKSSIDSQKREVADYDIRASQRPITELGDRDVESGPPLVIPSPSPPPPPPPCESFSQETSTSPIPPSIEEEKQDHDRPRSPSPLETFEDTGGFRYTPDDHGNVWVDFSPSSHKNPQHFSRRKKYFITTVAAIFTFFTSINSSSYAIGQGSMIRDLDCSRTLAAVGLSAYVWGFGLFPMVLAPFSEEFGRRPLYIGAVLSYFCFHFPIAKGSSIAMVIVFRFLQGGVGSVGATLVGGTLADIWGAHERGGKMSVFSLMAVGGTSFAPVPMGFVEANPNLEWRWIQWIQAIFFAAYLPSVWFMQETRAAVLLRRQTARLTRQHRKDREAGKTDGRDVTYLTRADVNKPSMKELLKISMIRPIQFLITEPVVIFFTIWLTLAWSVMYGTIQSMTYVFQHTYNFSIQRVGLAYLSMTIGTLLGYVGNFGQEYMYTKRVATKGAEARLYGALIAGIALPAGCFIYAWTTFSFITYVAPCIGIVIIMAAVFTIYLACYNYMADGYSLYASSAIAAQSLARNLVGGSFPIFSNPMYENLTPNWASTLFGCVAALLAVVPYAAFFFGPQLRARSKYLKLLVEEETKAKKMNEANEEKEGTNAV